MTGRVTATLVLLGLLGAAPATAQQEALKGLTEVEVLVESVDEQGWFCGVSQSVLFSAANKALLDNGVRIVPPETLLSTELSVSVHTLYSEALRTCVSSIETEVYQNIYATPLHSTQPVFGTFIFARTGGMLSSGVGVHGQRIRELVFGYVEKIALDIRTANQ